jgi:membrane protease YdiL (CAAX protease family)
MLVFFWGLLCLILCASRLKAAPRLLGLVALLYGLNELALMLPLWDWPVLGFGLQMNWTGKLLSTLLGVLSIYGWRVISPQEVGLRRPLRDSWRVIVPIGLVFAGAQFAGGFLNRHSHTPPSWEVHLFELTMPGIAEELFFRGILLGLLSRVYPRTIPFFGTRTSWGGLAGVVLFVLVHAVSFPKPLMLLPHTHFSWDLIHTTVYGAVFLWVRERSASCWAAMAVHNLTNVALFVGFSLP